MWRGAVTVVLSVVVSSHEQPTEINGETHGVAFNVKSGRTVRRRYRRRGLLFSVVNIFYRHTCSSRKLQDCRVCSYMVGVF